MNNLTYKIPSYIIKDCVTILLARTSGNFEAIRDMPEEEIKNNVEIILNIFCEEMGFVIDDDNGNNDRYRLISCYIPKNK